MNTRLRDAIAEVALRHAPRRWPSQEAAIQRVARALPEGSADVRRSKDYDALSEELAQGLRQGHALTGRQARDAAWCLWTTRNPLASDTAALEALLAVYRRLRHKGASRALAVSYLTDFRLDRPGLLAIAGTLRQLVDVMGKPFGDLHASFNIFDVTEGPRRVANAAVTVRKPPGEVLHAAGMTIEHVLRGGFVEPCARELLAQIAANSHLSALERLELVRKVAVTASDRKLIFATHKPLVANALLLPYRGASLADKDKDAILNLLIALDDLGDPRTKSANWVNMPEARDIAVSWLTRQALRQFLDVVEAVNPNQNWMYRRRFWESMEKHNVISEAWVVLDGAGVSEAQRRFGKNVQIGKFISGNGIQPGHAVMLLRIGKGVCAEWSYNGKCRFWIDAGNPGAPKLYQSGYDADALRSGRRYAPVEEIVHSTHTGENAWQHKAAKQISKMTGERFPRRDYM